MRQSRHYLVFITRFASSTSEFLSYLRVGLSFVLIFSLDLNRTKGGNIILDTIKQHY